MDASAGAGEPRQAPRGVDAVALARVRRRLMTAPEPPWLHAEAARRMAERLPVIRQRPDTVIDWWSAAGASTSLLRRTYPQARLLRVEPEPMPASRRPWWQRWRASTPAFTPDAVEPGQGGLLWASMMLHWVDDPVQEMRRWHAALAVDGFLMFSTFGPGTLASLRALYADAGWPSPHAPFVDMPDLGDMLVQAGFADPVMDQETLQLHWADALALLGELRGLGANVDATRFGGLRTPRWRDHLAARLQAASAGARPALDFEIVYGHAFKPVPRPQARAHTEVSLQDMRSILGARRQR